MMSKNVLTLLLNTSANLDLAAITADLGISSKYSL